MPSYRVMLDVPRDLIWFVSALPAARRRSIGTRKKARKLGCYRQALFGLAWFRDKGSIPRPGAGFGLSQATACRYIDEVIDVLAGQAPGLPQHRYGAGFLPRSPDRQRNQSGSDSSWSNANVPVAGYHDALACRYPIYQRRG